MAKATLTPAATTGRNILFTASLPVFLQGDVGRQIIFGASRAIIVTFDGSAGSGPVATVHADIIDKFPNTEVIPAGSWFLRISPQAALTPNVKGPVGTKITLTANKSAFRLADFGKFIHIYGGVIEIQGVIDTTHVVGEVLNDLKVNPISAGSNVFPPAVAGTWTLEVSSWSVLTGFPRTGEFAQGRLAQASTFAQPTTFWLSASDDFGNYATGIKATDAVEYAIASHAINRIEWMAESLDPLSALQVTMYLGGTNAEYTVSSGKPYEPFGGDLIPLVNRMSVEGSAPIQIVSLGNKIMFVDRSRKKIFILDYSPDDGSRIPIELTAIANHITGTRIKLGPLAYQKRPDHRVFFAREDGQAAILTYLPNEKVTGFSRFVTDGAFDAFVVNIDPGGGPDLVYTIVRRVINGVTKRYIEVFEENFGGLNRPWQSLQTDCAKVYQDVEVDNVPIGFLAHLEGKTVDVIASGGFRGTRVVVNGQFDQPLSETYGEIEAGLHYDATLETMRPSVQGTVIEGLVRNWGQLWVRLKDSIGGTLNGELITYPPGPLGVLSLFTGDRQVTTLGLNGNDTDGSIRIVQNQPYPFTVLCTFGTLEIGEHD